MTRLPIACGFVIMKRGTKREDRICRVSLFISSERHRISRRNRRVHRINTSRRFWNPLNSTNGIVIRLWVTYAVFWSIIWKSRYRSISKYGACKKHRWKSSESENEAREEFVHITGELQRQETKRRWRHPEQSWSNTSWSEYPELHRPEFEEIQTWY